jgi:hypothetical protein
MWMHSSPMRMMLLSMYAKASPIWHYQACSRIDHRTRYLALLILLILFQYYAIVLVTKRGYPCKS